MGWRAGRAGPVFAAERVRWVAWIGLLLLAVFPTLAATADLMQDLSGRLPSDHVGAFAAVAGRPFTAVTGSEPGAARYIRMLETGYAVHEFVFGMLFLLIVAIPLRRGQWWAWAACWVVLLADLGYRFTFGSHDATIAGRATIAAAGLPILLIAFAAARLALLRHGKLDAPAAR